MPQISLLRRVVLRHGTTAGGTIFARRRAELNLARLQYTPYRFISVCTYRAMRMRGRGARGDIACSRP
jgi:hypothetical protein